MFGFQNANPLETTFVQSVRKGSSAEKCGVEEGLYFVAF